MPWLIRLTALLLASTLPASAWAHVGFAANDLYAGMLHPLLHLPTILPMIAISLWISRTGQPMIRQLATVYLVACLAGAAGGWFTGMVIDLQPSLLLLAVTLGLLVAIDRQLHALPAIMLTIITGLAVGADNVAQSRANITDPLLYVTGLMLAAGILLLHITSMLQGCEQLWIRTGMRVVSSWIATAATLVLALQWSGVTMNGV